MADIQQALDILRGAVMIVYPMGLPPHDPITMEMNNEEDLSGTQASLDVSHRLFIAFARSTWIGLDTFSWQIHRLLKSFFNDGII